MQKIPLTQNKIALISDVDFQLINRYKWFFCKGYAMRSINRWKKKILMHRLITNCPKGLEVDHINHNSLDNRRENLRICTATENHRNTMKHKVNKTGFKGVNFRSDGKGFEAKIRFNGKKIHIGSFKKAEDAADAYDKKAKILFGNYFLPSKVGSL